MKPDHTRRGAPSQRLDTISRAGSCRRLVLFILLASTNLLATGQTEEEIRAKFLYRSHTFVTPGSISITRPYRLFVPDNYDPGESYPLVMTFHGRGELGDDNEIQISRYRLATAWADTINQNDHPAFVVAPQAPLDQGDPFYSHFVEFDESLIDSLTTEFSIDIDRIYAIGFSMGGDAVFRTLPAIPDRFAAAVPMGTSESTPPTRPDKLLELPIWIVHGRKDQIVSVEGSRAWVEALRHFGVTPVFLECDPEGGCRVLSDCTRRGAVRLRRLVYAEYENAGHDVVNRSLNDPVLIDWVFAQRRGQPTIGRVGPEVTVDVEASTLTAGPDHPSVGIVGSKTPLDWQDPVPLCQEFDQNVFGGTIAFPDTAAGALEYRFVLEDETGEQWVAEPRAAGIRSVGLTGGAQMLPVVFWGDENEQQPGPPVLVTPDDGSVTFRKTELSWRSGGVGGRYEVQVDTSAQFASPFYAQTALRLTRVELTGLDSLTTYHWRVRAANTVGAGEWSTGSFITLGLQTQLIAPEDGAVDQPQDVVLRWLPYPNATQYNLQIADTPDFAGVRVIRVQTATEHTAQGLSPGKRYYWRVRALNAWPSQTWSFVVSTATSISQEENDGPARFSLAQNYPNPFNPSTTISYSLAEPSDMTLTVYDVLGREVRQLASGTLPAGEHEATFDAEGLPSGVYLYRLEAGSFVETRHMILVK